MNVFLRKHLYILFSALLLPVALAAQTTVVIPVEIVQGETFETSFQSNPVPASIETEPENGTATLTENPSLNHTLTYTPNPDFTGQDVVVVERWECPFCPIEFREYRITVLPAKVEAFLDYATTDIGLPVSIDVLANDYSSRDTLILREIPLVNNGTATYQSGGASITFTPDAGFSGLTSFNYVVCDDQDHCDNGTVTVYVSDPQAGMADTLDVYTKKNLTQVILVPDGLSLQSGPDHGTYVDTDEAPEYSPDPGYIGLDYLSFDAPDGSETIVRIHVLDFQENAFAFDDEVHTVPNETVEFNVLDNDPVNNPCAFQVVEGPKFGSVTGSDGQMTYTPNPGFTGLDWFTYSIRPSMCAGAPEIAKVYIFVSNYEPAASKYRMSTPKQIPLIIGYHVPISDFEFQITDQGDLGDAIFLEGVVDTTINGQTVTGYNLILYVPDLDVTSGLDEFELVYCVQEAGGCAYEKTVKIEVDILDLVPTGPICIGDCVWAGDTNYDGVVNMEDLLPLGQYMGGLGLPRQADLINWYGQYGDDWSSGDFAQESINLKHLDTNGDSLITSLDTTAINLFYGNTHAITPVRIPYNEYDIKLQGDIFVEPGDLVELEMILGEDGSPAIDIYGLTFPFQYDPDFIVPESVGIDYSGNSWLTYNSPFLYMTRNNQDGLIESGFTRTSGISANGKGRIGEVRFIVSDDIIGFRKDEEELLLDIGWGEGSGVNSAGQYLAMNIEGVTLHISLHQSEEEEANVPRLEDLKVYPNPARDRLNVHLNGGGEFERVMIHSLTGQRLFESGDVLARNLQINLQNFQSGLYVLTVYTGNTVLNKKFEIMR